MEILNRVLIVVLSNNIFMSTKLFCLNCKKERKGDIRNEIWNKYIVLILE